MKTEVFLVEKRKHLSVKMDERQESADEKQYLTLEDFTNGALASIPLSDTFDTMCRRIFRVYGRQASEHFERWDDGLEDEIIGDYMKLLTPYMGPCPGDDEAFGFAFTVACCEHKDELSPREGYEYIPYQAEEHVFAGVSWQDLGLDQYLAEIKLDMTPEVFKTSLICWLNQTYNNRIYEHKLTPFKDADTKLLIVADFITRRYSKYRLTVETMISRLFTLCDDVTTADVHDECEGC